MPSAAVSAWARPMAPRLACCRPMLAMPPGAGPADDAPAADEASDAAAPAAPGAVSCRRRKPPSPRLPRPSIGRGEGAVSALHISSSPLIPSPFINLLTPSPPHHPPLPRQLSTAPSSGRSAQRPGQLSWRSGKVSPRPRMPSCIGEGDAPSLTSLPHPFQHGRNNRESRIEDRGSRGFLPEERFDLNFEAGPAVGTRRLLKARNGRKTRESMMEDRGSSCFPGRRFDVNCEAGPAAGARGPRRSRKATTKKNRVEDR